MSPLEQYRAIALYMLSCYSRKDWHAVSDAANDLRVMEAKHPELVGATIEEDEG